MTTDQWRAAWIAALEELETDVATVEAVIDGDHRDRELPPPAPWAPPTGLGPLPPDLRPRADVILGRQLAAARELSTAMSENRRQAAFAARVEAGDQGKPVPSYVDCAM